MASASSISKLHRLEQPQAAGNLRTNSGEGLVERKAQHVQAPPPVCADVRTRGRFRVGGREESESYTLDPGMLLSTMSAAAPLDQGRRFDQLREREQVARVVQQLAARGHRF